MKKKGGGSLAAVIPLLIDFALLTCPTSLFFQIANILHHTLKLQIQSYQKSILSKINARRMLVEYSLIQMNYQENIKRIPG